MSDQPMSSDMMRMMLGCFGAAWVAVVISTARPRREHRDFMAVRVDTPRGEGKHGEVA